MIAADTRCVCVLDLVVILRDEEKNDSVRDCCRLDTLRYIFFVRAYSCAANAVYQLYTCCDST